MVPFEFTDVTTYSESIKGIRPHKHEGF